MINNQIFFILIYFLIPFSTLGFGFLATSFFFNKKNIDIGFIGLTGIFVLIFYSYLSHFFYSHNQFHNLLLLLVGLYFFIIYFNKISFFEIKILISFQVILFISILIYKPHDDFSYYHFPYTYYLNEFSQIIGIGNFNHGFRTHSSIFYLNSLFYLPGIKYFLYHIGALLIMMFANTHLILNIIKKLKSKKIDEFFYLNLISFVFINIFFYRLAEHGTDRSAQILIFLLLIMLLNFRFSYLSFETYITKIFILTGIIVSLKSFYFVYFIFLIPMVFYILKDEKLSLIKNIFKNKVFYIFTLLISLNLLIYFLNTGCLLYPISQTCFANFDWGVPIENVKRMNLHYEWWSKGGGGPGYFSPIDPTDYVKINNWFPNWIDRYFFSKVSDFLGGIAIICIIIFLLFKSKYKKKYSQINYKLFYLTLFVLFLEWFFYHPSLRYGGYVIISLIIFIPLSIFMSRFNLAKNKLIKYSSILIILTISIFLIRNIDRIFYEVRFYNFDLINSFNYKIEDDYFRIDNLFKKQFEEYEKCKNENRDCIFIENYDLKKLFRKFTFIKDN